MQFFSRLSKKVGVPTNRSEKWVTILVLMVALNILAVIKMPIQSIQFEYLLYGSITLGVLSMLFKWVLESVVLIWYGLAWLLSLMTSRILLFVVFFLILMPIGFLSRMFKRDELKLKRPLNSNFIDCPQVYSGEDLVNPW